MLQTSTLTVSKESTTSMTAAAHPQLTLTCLQKRESSSSTKTRTLPSGAQSTNFSMPLPTTAKLAVTSKSTTLLIGTARLARPLPSLALLSFLRKL